jgi:hypothetical protein
MSEKAKQALIQITCDGAAIFLSAVLLFGVMGEATGLIDGPQAKAMLPASLLFPFFIATMIYLRAPRKA